MYRKTITLLFVLITLFSNNFAQTKTTIEISLKEKPLPYGLTTFIPADKPTVSLVLSGGGSRAISHIGVLKALQEYDIQIDHIVGTSMGSVVGGLYSLGYSISEIDTIVNSINWTEVFSLTSSDRTNLFVDQKITEDKSLLSVRLNGLKPSIPQSFNSGFKISNILTLLSYNAPINNFSNFNNFLYKYRAVTTDLITGKKIVIGDGCISTAMRASSSISFLLPPIKKDSLILIDGGVVDNLPILSALELSPDFIIASDATSPLRNPDELNYPWEVADQIVSIPSKKISEESKSFADVLISHDLHNRKNNDFKNLNSIIQNGYDKAKFQLANVKSKIETLYNSNLAQKDTIYKNLKTPNNPNNLEIRFVNKFKQFVGIRKSEIKKFLIENYSTGFYKNIKAEIISDSSSIIRIISTINPKITSINFDSLGVISTDSAFYYYSNLVGNHFNPNSVLKSTLEFVKYCKRNNLIFAKVEKVNFDEITGELNILFNDGRISEIEVQGNNRTLSAVITREFPKPKNQIFIKEDLEDGLRNLSTTNLFNNLEVGVDTSSVSNKLVIGLEEKLPTVLRLGLKIDNEYYTQAAFDLRNENLFGTGSELGLSIGGSLRKMDYVLEHKANRIFDTYLTYKAQAFYNFVDINTYAYDSVNNDHKFSRSRVGEYRQTSYGGFLGIGAHLQRLGTLTAEGKYQVDEVENLENFSEDRTYELNISSVKLRLQIDSQNEYPYPTKGSRIDTYYETAQKFLGSDVSFAKFSFNYEGYFTFNNRHTIKPKIIFGFADETLPLSQQFSFGGQENFWGYRDYEFRGRQILVTSLEYRYKLPFSIYVDTYLKLRYDIGSTWINQEQIKFNDLKHGLGLSLSFDTPIGPADFSVGRSLLLQKTSPERIVSRGPLLFYFTIGYYY